MKLNEYGPSLARNGPVEIKPYGVQASAASSSE